MSIVSLFIWWLLGWLIGILVFIAAPIVAPEGMRYGLAQWYYGLSMAAYRRVVCPITPRNTASVAKSTWDGERQSEQIAINGHDYDFFDPRGSTLRCKNRPWAFVLSDKNVVVHPADAEIGGIWKDLVDTYGRFKTYRWETKARADGGEDEGEGEEERTIKEATAGLGYLSLDRTPKAVDMRDALPMINERYEPNDAEQTEEDIKKSQEGFKSMPAMESIMLLLACLGGTGAAWFIYSNTGSGGSSPVTVPITLVYHLPGVIV